MEPHISNRSGHRGGRGPVLLCSTLFLLAAASTAAADYPPPPGPYDSEPGVQTMPTRQAVTADVERPATTPSMRTGGPANVDPLSPLDAGNTAETSRSTALFGAPASAPGGETAPATSPPGQSETVAAPPARLPSHSDFSVDFSRDRPRQSAAGGYPATASPYGGRPAFAPAYPAYPSYAGSPAYAPGSGYAPGYPRHGGPPRHDYGATAQGAPAEAMPPARRYRGSGTVDASGVSVVAPAPAASSDAAGAVFRPAEGAPTY